jgi:hypothetical protein
MEEKTKTKVLKMRGAPGKVRSDERMSDGRWQGAELEVAYMFYPLCEKECVSTDSSDVSIARLINLD